MDDNKVESAEIRTMFEVALPLMYSEDYHRGYIVGYARQGHPNWWDVRRKLAQIQKAKFSVPYELVGEAVELEASEEAASGFDYDSILEETAPVDS